VIEVHRIRFARRRPQARPARKRRSRERRPHALHVVLGVTHDGFAYMGNQVVEEAGAQHSQSPVVANRPLGDATSMISKSGRHSSLLLVFSRSY
jgi:hypothetical protein